MPYTTVETRCEKQGVKQMEKKSAARPPIKTFRSGNIQGAIWLNEREKEGQIFSFKTASLRKSWFDKEKNMWMNESINLRRQDLTKALVILTKLQEELFLNDEEDEENE